MEDDDVELLHAWPALLANLEEEMNGADHCIWSRDAVGIVLLSHWLMG